MIVSRQFYLSSRVGYLSDMASYNRVGLVSGSFYPWVDSPMDGDAFLHNFILENADDFHLENDDQFVVRDPD